jgi:hypothetical protein
MDQYRDSADRVEIWVDGGLLGSKDRWRFFYA